MIVDFHNHLMPYVDDGAQTADECRSGLEAFKRDGVALVVATPHFEASATTKPEELRRRLEQLDAGFRTLQSTAKHLGGVEVRRGVELLLNVPNPDLADARLRLGGGSFFLTEFPFFSVPPHSARVLQALAARGHTPIVAHPERYRGISANIEIAGEWRRGGAFLQVNGGSLVGRYGAEARAAAFELLGRGWVDYLCSDYHARGDTLVAQYGSLLEGLGAREQATMLMQTNPARMLDGLAPLSVQPLQVKRTIWRRVAAIFRS